MSSRRSRMPKLLSVLLPLGLVVAAAPAAAAECKPWCGAGDGALYLVEASYEVDVFGAVAAGRLVQEFRNEGREAVRVSYRFPGHAGLRARSLQVRLDGELLEAEQQPDSRTTPGRARVRAQGNRTPSQLASPQFVLEPGQQVTAVVGFQQVLTVEEGLLRLHLPAIDPAVLAGGRSRVASPVADPEDLPVGLRVIVHHDEPLSAVESDTHEVLASYDGARTSIDLVPGVDLGRRAFELRLALGVEDEPTLVGYVGRVRKDVREVVAVLTPPSKPRRESVRPKQMVFVLDTSGSMGKEDKVVQARDALYASLKELGENDRFNIIEFDSQHTLLSPEPLNATAEALQQAGAWLRAQRASGGTKLVAALREAFTQPQSDERHSMVVVLTDGAVQDPREVEQLLQEKLNQGRLFFVGIGDDAKEETILRFAEIGRGTAAFAKDSEELGGAVAVLFNSISRPLAWDLEVDWGGADAELVGPARLPDLYAGRPVTVFARVRGELPAVLKVHASTMEGEQVFTVVLPEESYGELPTR